MRGKTFRDQNKVVEETKSRNDYWKRRPSEIRGYQKAFYINGTDGSYVRVDYNLKDKKIRLYVEDASEGGIAYYSVISKGNIEVEKNLATGRRSPLPKCRRRRQGSDHIARRTGRLRCRRSRSFPLLPRKPQWVCGRLLWHRRTWGRAPEL